MGKPIHIYTISRNYTSAKIYWGSRSFRNLLGTSTCVLDKGNGLTRKERYGTIARWLVEQTGLYAPSYRPTKSEKKENHGT